MIRKDARPHYAESGFTIIELLVAAGIFVLFILVIDAVFFGVNRSARKTELAADVQQNARIAIERLTQEVRESSVSEVAVGGTAGSMAVVFKSARLVSDNAVFCAYVRTTTEPLYNSGCFYWPAAPTPPYTTNPPYAAPCNTSSGAPCAAYGPIWQRYIGYYIVDVGGGVKELRRVAAPLLLPTAVLPDPTLLTGGDVIASRIESFDVALSSATLSVTLKARGTEYVQGSTLPSQEMRLPSTTLTRN